jgi:hypothetical protein
MGRILTGARRTVSPSVADAAMPFINSKNCVAWMMEYAMPESSISFSWACLARK